jgi:hypothetical protein
MARRVVSLALVASASALATASTVTVVHVIPDEGAARGMRAVRQEGVGGYAPLPGQPSLAWAVFNNSVNATGWATLEVHGNASYPNVDVAWAAGFAEGVASGAPSGGGENSIFDYITSTGADVDLGAKLDAFLAANRLWVQGQAASNPASPYWSNVALVYEQLDGLAAGYASTAPPSQQLPASAFLTANLAGDLYDLIPAVGGPRDHPVLRSRSGVAGNQSAVGDTHCSALFRLLPDGSDVLAAHTTWSGLNTMLRQMKLYDLPFASVSSDPSSPTVPAVRVAFSGYPATLSSVDDFYVTSGGLVVIETTIGNNNASLYQYVVPESVLEWHRVVVANRLSTTSPGWVATFSGHNSGTYNNEWMVADAKLFTPGKPLPANFFVVADQMPKYIGVSDRTEYIIENGFWPSFNVPSDEFIFDVSNQDALVAKYGPFFSWTDTARHNIFRRDAPGIVDLPSMQRMMRYDNFTHDPLATQGLANDPPTSGCETISARADLNPENGTYLIPDVGYGNLAGIDSKITSVVALKAAVAGTGPLTVWAQSGPSYDSQPAFSWANTTLRGINNAGQPTVWNFPWVTFTW